MTRPSLQSLQKIILVFIFPCLTAVTSSFCCNVSLKRRVAIITPKHLSFPSSPDEGTGEISRANISSRLYASSSSSTTVPIIACSSNIELERAISFYIKPGDVVLELGSQLNDISKLIYSKIIPDGDQNMEKGSGSTATTVNSHTDGAHAVLFGLGLSKDPKSGRVKTRNNLPSSLYDRVTFQELEQFDQWRDVFNVKLDTKTGSTNNTSDMESTPKTATSSVSYDVMVLDVGTMIGNDLYLTALSIANEFIAYHKLQEKRIQSSDDDNNNQNDNIESRRERGPRVILIKSKILSNLARRIIHSQRLLNGSSYIASKIRTNASSSTSNNNYNYGHKGEGEEEAPLKYAPRSSKPYIIAVVGVNEYRRTIPHVVRYGDEILEVGCHFGQSTVLLHEAAAAANDCVKADDGGSTSSEQGHSRGSGFCVGVDIGPKIIEHANTKYPHVPFAVGNAWNVLQLLKVKSESLLARGEEKPCETTSSGQLFQMGYDLVYADIGGLSGPDGLMESLSLLDSLGNSLEPRCIVIKSLCMNRLSSQLTAFSDVWHKIK